MNSTIKHMQLNLNNEAKQAQRKAEEKAAYERIHKDTKKTIDARRAHEQDT